MLQEIVSDTEEKFQATIEHLKSELATIRSSQTSPSLVEDIEVSAYDGSYPLKELAAISVPEPNLILIQPWDHSIVENIESALNQSNLGVSPAVDGANIRLAIPALSQERREEMVRKVGEIVEETRVAIRNIRQDKMKSLDNLEENGKISEDERDRTRKQIQSIVDDHNEQIEKIKTAKTASLELT